MNAQDQINKNLERMFETVNAQADTQLVDTLADTREPELTPADLMLNTADVTTILTLDHYE